LLYTANSIATTATATEIMVVPFLPPELVNMVCIDLVDTWGIMSAWKLRRMSSKFICSEEDTHLSKHTPSPQAMQVRGR
jgi:hypothetical protein